MTRLGLMALPLAGFLVLTVAALGQDRQDASLHKPNPPKAQNTSTIYIQSVSTSATGISVEILGQNVHVLSASVERQDNVTGSNLPVVNSVGIVDIPPEISNPSVQAMGTAKFPIVVSSNPNTMYTLTLWAKSVDDPNMDWGTPQTRIFRGYAAPAPPTSPTFKLEFSSDALNVSVDTPEIKTVKAQWQVGNNTISTESTTSQNPKVALKFAALQVGAGQPLPSLILTLEDPKTHEIQESRVTLAVAADQNLKGKVTQAKSDPGRQRISWQDVARSGVGAILTYFLGGL